jgi:hypothetical protein
MALFQFLNGLKVSRMANFWSLDDHDIPALPGAYLLVAKSSVHFLYPAGRSPIFYIGLARSLRQRLQRHRLYAGHRRDGYRQPSAPLYWPRYEYAGAFGARYCYIRTWSGCTPKALEDIVLARFQKRYHARPVANSAGAWNRVWDEFKSV